MDIYKLPLPYSNYPIFNQEYKDYLIRAQTILGYTAIANLIMKYGNDVTNFKIQLFNLLFYKGLKPDDFAFFTKFMDYPMNVILPKISERCPKLTKDFIGFYTNGDQDKLLASIYTCGGFCDFPELYQAMNLGSDKMIFVNHFCTKANKNFLSFLDYDDMKGPITLKYHLAVWILTYKLCDIILFYLNNSFDDVPEFINVMKNILAIPLRFLCNIGCIDAMSQYLTPQALVSFNLTSFITTIFNTCNPTICSLFDGGLNAALGGTPFEYILIPGKFMCDTICCGTGDQTLCNCCKSLKVRDLKNEFSIYLKLAICVENLICAVVNNQKVMNDILPIGPIQNILKFCCVIINDLKILEDVINQSFKSVLQYLEQNLTISFDTLFSMMMGGLECQILNAFISKYFSSDAAKMISWVCNTFANAASCILKSILGGSTSKVVSYQGVGPFQQIAKNLNPSTWGGNTSGGINIGNNGAVNNWQGFKNIEHFDDLFSGNSLNISAIGSIPEKIFNCIDICSIINTINLPSPLSNYLSQICSQCVDTAKSIAIGIMTGSPPSFDSIAEDVIDCVGICTIVSNELSYVPGASDICSTCSSVLRDFAKAALLGSPPSASDVAKDILSCVNPCNIPGLNFVCNEMKDFIVNLAKEGFQAAKDALKEAARAEQWAQDQIVDLADKGYSWAKDAAEDLYNQGVSGIKEAGEKLDPTSWGGSCFTGETLILTDNGNKKIIDIVPGENVITISGQSKRVKRNSKLTHPEGHLVCSINNSEPFFTDEHLFYTTDGWKSMNPTKSYIETPSITNINKLQPGDQIGNTIIDNVQCIKSDKPFDVYTLDIEGEQTHFANNLPVHSMSDYSIDDQNEKKMLLGRVNNNDLENLKKLILNNQKGVEKLFGKYKTSRLINQIKIAV